MLRAAASAAQVLQADLAVCGGRAAVHILNDTLRWIPSTAAAAAATGSTPLVPPEAAAAAEGAAVPAPAPEAAAPGAEAAGAAGAGGGKKCLSLVELLAATPGLDDPATSRINLNRSVRRCGGAPWSPPVAELQPASVALACGTAWAARQLACPASLVLLCPAKPVLPSHAAPLRRR